MNKHLFLYPELLSRLIFSSTSDDKYLIQATHNQQARSAKPEEIIRQIFVLSLIHHYHYPEDRIRLEQSVLMGRERKRADIIVTGDGDSVELVIEVKQEIDSDAIEQLRSYLMATGSRAGAVVSGHGLRCFMRSENKIIEIDDLPLFGGKSGDAIDTVVRSARTPSSDLADPIELFQRTSRTKAKITIKNHTIQFDNALLTNLKKVRQRFSENGVIFGASLDQQGWLGMIEARFDGACMTSSEFDFDEKLRGKVLSHMDEYVGISVKVMCNKIRSSPENDIKDCLETMVHNGLATKKFIKPTRGKGTEKYFLSKRLLTGSDT